MSGKLGVVCVVVAMMLTGFLGFLGSVDEVESNVTNWDYVTDVAGAFDSDKSDMFSRYNPSANLTGYSAFQKYNESFLTGAEYSTSSGANEWFFYTSQAGSAAYSIELTPDTGEWPNVGGWTGAIYNANGNLVGSVNDIFKILHGWNENNHVSRWNGSVSYDGAVAIKMSDLVAKIKEKIPLSTIVIQANGSNNSIIGLDVSYSQIVSMSRGYIDILTPSSTTTAVTVDSATGTISAEGQTVSLDEAYYAWQANGSSDNMESSFTFSIYGASTTGYLDPTAGVTPTQQTISTTTITTQDIKANHVTINLSSAEYVGMQSKALWQGTLYMSEGNISKALLTISYSYNSGLGGCQYSVTWMDGHTETSSKTTSLTINLDINSASLESTVSTLGYSSTDVSFTEVAEIQLTGVSSYLNSMSGTYSEDYSQSLSGTFDAAKSGNVWSAKTMFQEIIENTETNTYTNTYWNNNYKMSEMSIIFKRPTADIEQRLNLHGIADANGYEHMSSTIISYTQAGGWSIITGGRISPYSPYFGDANVNLGQWPAIIINVNLTTSTLSVQPITTFTNFTDYSYIESLQTKICDIDSNGSYIDYMVIPDTNLPKMSMSVTNTVIYIEGGGLYMQNATISTNEKFGSSVADRTVKISFDSFVRIGDGITVNNVRFNVNSDKSTILIDDKAHPLARTTAVYVPEAVGAFYYRGSTYAAGHAYLIDSDNGVTDCGTATDLDVTLNGTWLTTANMSLGTNEHTSTPTWGGSNWSLDVNGTIVIFIGFLIICAIVGKIKLGMDALDIAIILGSAIIALMVIA